MTHKDIYVKFMIEYDKANITSSYPSLTKYEIATILDKAYLALIAQKVTGNNQRKVGFEADVKAIEDLRPLITSKTIDKSLSDYSYSNNDYTYGVPSDLLYYVDSKLIRIRSDKSKALDSKNHYIENINLIDHKYANRFLSTDSNMPWIPVPVMFFDSSVAHVLVDPYKLRKDLDDKLKLIYLKKPFKFIDSLTEQLSSTDNNSSNNSGSNSNQGNNSSSNPSDSGNASGNEPSSPDINIPTQDVEKEDIITHYIIGITGSDKIINSGTYTARAYNSNGIDESVIWSISKGSEYAIIVDGKVTVKTGANNSKVVITATNSVDTTKHVSKTIYVTYQDNITHYVHINGPDIVNNESNTAQYTCTTDGTVLWKIISDDDYAFIDLNGKLTVNSNANNNKVRILAYLKEDEFIFETFDVIVTYNESITNTNEYFKLDYSSLNVDVLTDVEIDSNSQFTLDYSLLNKDILTDIEFNVDNAFILDSSMLDVNILN